MSPLGAMSAEPPAERAPAEPARAEPAHAEPARAEPVAVAAGASAGGASAAPGGWRRVVRIAYLVLVLAAFVAAVVARREDLTSQLQRTDPLPLGLAIMAGLTGVGVSGLVWRRTMHGLGSVLPLRAALKVFFVAQVGKYLPGSVWPVLAQAELGRDHGVPRRSAVAAQTLFMWVHLVTGALLGIPTLAATGTLPAWTVAAVPLLVLGLLPRPLTGTIDWLLGRLGRAPLPARPAPADMAVATGWALVMWVLYGLHTHWLIDAFEFPSPGVLPVIVATGAFAAAWSAGFVFLIAPAGAGAREVVLVAALSSVTAPETAFTVTLLSRLLLTLADGAWAAVGMAAGIRRGPAQPAGPGPAGSAGSGVEAAADDGPRQGLADRDQRGDA